MMRTRWLFLGLFPSVGIAWRNGAPSSTVVIPTRSFSSVGEITEAPAVHPDLLRRVLSTGTRTAFLSDSNTCGFLNANLNSAIGCNVGYLAVCGLFIDNFAGTPASQGAMGCCHPDGQTASACAAFTKCLDYSMITSLDSCANICGTSINVLQCTDPASPYCTSFIFSNVFTDAAKDINFVGYQCVDTPGGLAQGAYTTFAGQTTAANYSTTTVLVVEQVSRSTSPSTSSKSLSSGLSTSSSSPASSPTTTPSQTLSPPVENKDVPAGPIAGGVVGGLAVIALIAAGTFFWIRRNRRSKKAVLAVDRPEQGASGHFPRYVQKGPVIEAPGDDGGHEMMDTSMRFM